jgi:hypothetical protein
MISFTNDLQRDIFWLDTVIRSAKVRIANLDSFLITIIQIKKDEIPVPVYQQLRRSTTQIMFFSNDGTMTQLKNSGGMRLIRNKDVIDSIEEYDRYMRRLEVRRDITDVLAHDLTITLNKTVQGKDVAQTIYDTTVLERNLALQSIRLDGQYVNELINQCITLRSRAAGDTSAFTFTRRSALQLINFISDRYHLK